MGRMATATLPEPFASTWAAHREHEVTKARYAELTQDHSEWEPYTRPDEYSVPADNHDW
jgi:hypothetical protein